MYKSTGFEYYICPLQLSPTEIVSVYELQKWKAKDVKEQAVKSGSRSMLFQKVVGNFYSVFLFC